MRLELGDGVMVSVGGWNCKQKQRSPNAAFRGLLNPVQLLEGDGRLAHLDS
jgi:hypothetical protein